MKIMNPIRTVYTLLFRRGRRHPTQRLSTQLNLCVMPWDLHFRVAHMDAYGFFMELGRWDQARIEGILWPLIRKGTAPFTQLQTIRFCKPLKLFQKITVHTEIVYMREYSTYCRHAIYHQEKLVCYGLIKYSLIGSRGRIHGKSVYPSLYESFSEQAVPNFIRLSSEFENALFEASNV